MNEQGYGENDYFTGSFVPVEADIDFLCLMAIKEDQVIFREAVDAMAGDHILKACTIEDQSIDDGLCKNDRR